MEYEKVDKASLIERIEELELLNHQLMEEKSQATGLDYPWTGNLGHWYWNIKSNTVKFNLLKATTLGYEESEIPDHVTYQFFTEKLHLEDYQKTMDAMLLHLQGKALIYEVEYRIQAKDGSYKWYYDRGKITQYDEKGKPLFLAGIVFDITKNKEQQLELEKKNQMLKELAFLDGLTKISNHKALVDYLESQIQQVRNSKEALSVIMFDIDDFKKVNDNKGHVLGDCILYEMSGIIKENIPKAGLVGRYGGEEFLIVLPQIDVNEAVLIAEKNRKLVEEHKFACGVQITLSGGVKQFEGEQLVDLINAVDKRLYMAKKNGKNTIVWHDDFLNS
jgi:diguanylate cyclase (GGDEF)-like protein/PAS domain S-box-containing protein